MPIEFPDFVDRLKQSGLVSPAQLAEIEAAAQASHEASGDVTASLRDGKLLTDYQLQVLVGDATPTLLIAERYEIRDKLGAGGMGEVYLAHDRQLDRDVALKVLAPRLVADDDSVARFEREAKAMARLEHPAIVRAYDSGFDGDRHFLVMEYVRGASVDVLLGDVGQLEPPIAADYAYQTALGLKHAHKKGLIHRDLKPSNLLVGQDGRLKILDLGLARFLQDQIDDETITVAGAGLGTPDFMAPEQFGNARNADERSDVYALGCTLYRMLAGHVPFPGSSLSQKRQDHQSKAPDTLERSAPNAPTGLAQAVYKMMAKAPADRFQTAAQCAEALTPYVANSSASLTSNSGTLEWEGSQLTIVSDEIRRRRLTRWSAIGAMMAVIGMAAGFGLAQLGRDDGGRSPDNSEAMAAEGSGHSGQPEDTGDVFAPGDPMATADPWVLTVAQDGSGQYQSIGEALENVKEGQTVRVLDKGPYREPISLVRRHQGVTLEAVNAAIIESTEPQELIHIENVSDVALRGFRLKSTHTAFPDRGTIFITVKGNCPGLLLEQLDADNSQVGAATFVALNCHSADSVNPIVIRECRFLNAMVAINLNGVRNRSIKNVIIRDNLIDSSTESGIMLQGTLEQVQIVANRLVSNYTGIFLTLPQPMKGVVIANNTFHETVIGMVGDFDAESVSEIVVKNNLFLASQGPDLAYVDGTNDEPGAPLRPRDGQLLHTAWKLGSNWRESTPPTGRSPFEIGWVPPSETDVQRDTISGVNRSHDDVDFLRPVADSPLATEGAGKTDPALPSYVGALPPPGRSAWDWTRTWRAPPGKNSVLTVSQDVKDGGKYRTINEALRDAKPWDTVRVIDAETYPEAIRIEDAQTQRGITLESTLGATIQTRGETSALLVDGVDDISCRGFRFRQEGDLQRDLSQQPAALIEVRKHCQGGRFENLDVDTKEMLTAILLLNVNNQDSRPLLIRNCDLTTDYYGIELTGLKANPSRALRIEGNRIRAQKPIGIEMRIVDVLIAENQILFGRMTNLELREVIQHDNHLVIANNTLFGGASGVRLWHDLSKPQFEPDKIVFQNNVLSQATFADMFLLSRVNDQLQPIDSQALNAAWRLGGNFRDLTGSDSMPITPLASIDYELPKDAFLSTSLSDDDFLRPPSGSLLATGGVGGSLPTYAGAIPPEGIESWDWDVTWRECMLRTKYSTAASSAGLPTKQ